jgi:hypothetical protein
MQGGRRGERVSGVSRGKTVIITVVRALFVHQRLTNFRYSRG